MSVLSKPYFHNETAAFAFVEKLLWADGPHCFHCGAVDRITKVTANPEKRVRHGLYRCGHCKGQFTVRMGTIFEESKLPMTKWLQAIYLMCSSKKGVSSLQLSRTLEITYKSAWFLTHRIREAMREGTLASTPTRSRLLQHLQARHARRLPALRREAPSPLHGRV